MGRGGPRSSAGKAISSRNAVRHGVLAAIPVVPGLERQEDWEAHRAGVLASLSPEGHIESVLAERVALQLWRLHRVARYEALTIVTAQETVEKDVTDKRRRWRLDDPSPAAQLEGTANDLRQQQEQLRCLHQLPALADDAPLSAADADLLMRSVEEVAQQTDRNDISIPFIPSGAAIDDYPDWTAGKLRWVLTAWATLEGRDVADLVTTALKEAAAQLQFLEKELAKQAAQAAQEKGECAAQVERAQRERLLLSEPAMERVARYEAHLSRELYKAMHELEALQERRQGRPALLARLDVTGVPDMPKLRNELPA